MASDSLLALALDHAEIPDAITIIGVTDGQLSMHYFDSRGVYRVYAASLDQATWRTCVTRLNRLLAALHRHLRRRRQHDHGSRSVSQDGKTWEDDLDLNYQRVA